MLDKNDANEVEQIEDFLDDEDDEDDEDQDEADDNNGGTNENSNSNSNSNDNSNSTNSNSNSNNTNKNDDNDNENSEEDSDEEDDDIDYDSSELARLEMEQERIARIQETISAIKSGQAGDIIEDAKRDLYNKQKLRKYELQKLRYYYAIVECDSIETADRLYQECDGREFQTTCNIMDLRFVVDDFEAPFAPRDECTNVPENYIPAPNNQSNCLGSTFVSLSWDQTDPSRKEITEKIFTNDSLMKMDLSAYLASDGGITDAGFDTDYPVTEYDTDTPNKKVPLKRRARNRYKGILEEFETLEKNVRLSQKNVDDISSSDDNDNSDNSSIDSEASQKKKKAVKAVVHSEFINDDGIEHAKIAELQRIQNVRISSDDDDSDEEEEDSDVGNGNNNEKEKEKEKERVKMKEDTKYSAEDLKALKKLNKLDDSDDSDDDDDDILGSKPKQLENWIDNQQSINMFERNINRMKKTSESKTKNKSNNNGEDNDDDDVDKVSVISDIDNERMAYNEELSSDDESLLDDNNPNTQYAKEDPYFRPEMLDSDSDNNDNDNGPPKKRRRISKEAGDGGDGDEGSEDKEAKERRRAELELLLMNEETKTNNNLPDPEELEYDKHRLSHLRKNFNKRLNRDWRLRRAVKNQVKKKLKEMDTFKFNKDDSRFSALYQDPNFAIDPTSTSFKQTTTNETIMKQTRLMRNENGKENIKETNKDKENEKEKEKDQDKEQEKEKENMKMKDDSSNETKDLIESLKMKSKLIPALRDGNTQRQQVASILKSRQKNDDDE